MTLGKMFDEEIKVVLAENQFGFRSWVLVS
jgi:hypothetical protein